MIATLGLLAGRTWRRRAGYAALAFGAWDIFYYVFLRLISGWPSTLLDWDGIPRSDRTIICTTSSVDVMAV